MHATTRSIRANGIDLHYLELGRGAPLVLLHGGMVTTNPIWTGHPFAYTSHLEAFAEHFRVIAPDTRGAGRTVHAGGTPTFDVLASDVLALIEALGLERPRLCGFSEGGTTATIVGMRAPDRVGAIVNDAGYDLFNPAAPSFTMLRTMFGGRPDATEADPDGMRAKLEADPHMRASFDLMRADQDGAQGDGHWRRYLQLAFDRLSRPPGYTFPDLARIATPTLMLVGDRDQFCSVEEGTVAYRHLAHGALAILPSTGHVITPAKVRTSIEFLRAG